MTVKNNVYVKDLSRGGEKVSVANPITCGGTNVDYSDSFEIFDDNVSLELLFTSDGDVAVDVICEQGNIKLLPAEEQAANANYVVPVNKSAVALDNKTVNLVAVSLVVSKYSRVRLTGTGTNHATTKCVRCNFVTV